MKHLILTLLTGVLICGFFHLTTSDLSHEQVHINIGSKPMEMVITWHTINYTTDISDTPQVQYGTYENSLDKQSPADVVYLKMDFLYTYRALLANLNPETTYYYKVGSPNTGYSKVYHFKTFKSGNNWLPKIIIMGDLGWQNQESLPPLKKDVLENNYDIIFHIGDFAYDLHDRRGEKGSQFMNTIEPVASFVPYMALPGNHEYNHNYTHYDARFSMLGDYLEEKPSDKLLDRLNNHYHSEDVGPVHFISFSAEYYTFTQWGWNQIKYQHEWLVEDLKKANANRAKTPWIIVLTHRGLYCLRLGDAGSCVEETADRPDLRLGIAWQNNKNDIRYGLEKLFYDNGVDLMFAGHEHLYGRLFPTYNHESYKDGDPYNDPKAPIQITSGCAGNRELHPAFNLNQKAQSFMAAYFLDYGYGRLIFNDRLTMTWEEITTFTGKVKDTIVIRKSQDKPQWLR